jgi:hypothetical protein
LPVIEASFERTARLLERVLSNRAYLFGGRPCLADFGLAGQFAQLLSDPTPGAFLKANASSLVRWVDRMENPDAQGEFITFAHAADDFAEFLRAEVASVYLPWMAANADAVAEDGLVRVQIDGRVFGQKPQRYAAKALAEIQRKFQQVAANEVLLELMSSTGCREILEVAPDDEETEQNASDES